MPFINPPIDLFCVTVRGDLMSPAIDHGDVITCSPADWRDQGFVASEDYVVGLIDGRIFCRRVSSRSPDGCVRLVAGNPADADVVDVVPLDDVLWAARVTVVTMACVYAA